MFTFYWFVPKAKKRLKAQNGASPFTLQREDNRNSKFKKMQS